MALCEISRDKYSGAGVHASSGHSANIYFHIHQKAYKLFEFALKHRPFNGNLPNTCCQPSGNICPMIEPKPLDFLHDENL
jgi:hypothetical protein